MAGTFLSCMLDMAKASLRDASSGATRKLKLILTAARSIKTCRGSSSVSQIPHITKAPEANCPSSGQASVFASSWESVATSEKSR